MTEPAQLPPLPDRLSIDPRSPFHIAAVFEHDVGIRLNDKWRADFEACCISVGLIKLPADETLERRSNPLLIKLKDKVDAYY